VDAAFDNVERIEESKTATLARIGLAAGAASVILLALAIRFAWNPLSLAIVTAWALSTLGAMVASGRSLRDATRSRRLAKWGVALGSVSILALALAGFAYAAGTDPTGACGGG
jgi:hypothetical protein